MFVLDTDACVDIRRGHRPTIDMVNKLEQGDRVAVTAVTVVELVQGAHGARHPDHELDIVRRWLAAFDILEFNGAAGWIAGRISAQHLSVGRPIGNFDTMIAASVIAHQGTLVTRNIRHFDRVDGLQLHPLA